MLAAHRTRTWLLCCLGLVPMLAGNRGCEPEPPPPTVCPKIWAPVCGADGVTYSSECHADAAGVDVAYEGECNSDGGLCLSNDDCAMGQACDHSECLSGCPDGAETCIAVCYGRCTDEGPIGCDDDGDCARGEICVFDGGPAPLPFEDEMIYRPEHGICVPVEPPPVGCFSDADCSHDEVCSVAVEPPFSDDDDSSPGHPGEGSAGGSDGSDGAPDRRFDCACTREYAPVCGADGVTYSNACEAACSGVPAIHEGECDVVAPPPAPGVCVPRDEPTACWDNYICDLYCEFGFQTGADGCEICGLCNPAPVCDPVVCTLACEFGLATGDDGCEVCSCNPAPVCDPVVCTLACEFGLATGDDGCEVCSCNPAP